MAGRPNRIRCWLIRQSTAAVISAAEAEVAGASALGQGAVADHFGFELVLARPLWWR
jgi:hypothetical protein